MDLQPHLRGELVELRPLKPEDFERLYQVAQDPLIWEQHSENTRHQKPVFEKFFAGAIASKGAFLVLNTDGEAIGCTRFTGLTAEKVEIGYTFLARAYWGRGHNGEMKRLMLEHAFGSVKKVEFYIGEKNLRSRQAVEKLGARLVRRLDRLPAQGDPYVAVVYEISPPSPRSP